MSFFDLIAGLLTICALFAWVNNRFFHLPANIGMLVMGLAASHCMIGVEVIWPGADFHETLVVALQRIDFYDTLMNGMLAFLLFAGALHVDFSHLRQRAAVVATLATIGVVVSALVVAVGTWFLADLLGTHIPFVWALVFGTLIAPTDPVAVLATLKSVDVPKTLETDISAEALFNDGIAVALFTLALELAGDDRSIDLAHVGELLALEAGGGGLLGLFTGYLAYRALHAIDDYGVEILVTLALVTGTYALASALHMSGPIAVVVAGLIIGNRGARFAMSETTNRYLFGFWTLIDDLLNAVLFLLIGLEVLVLSFQPELIWLGIGVVPLVLAARFSSVVGATLLLRRWHAFARGTALVMTWGGVRGGISVALALALPNADIRPTILAATYAVVIFSVIVQGLSLQSVMRRVLSETDADG